jgi:hypothetical protein
MAGSQVSLHKPVPCMQMSVAPGTASPSPDQYRFARTVYGRDGLGGNAYVRRSTVTFDMTPDFCYWPRLLRW